MRQISRNLFPDARNFRIHAEKKHYIQSKILDQIRAGTLYLTAILRQPEVDTIGEVVFGLGRDDNMKLLTPSWPTPPELINATVRLVSIDYQPGLPPEQQPKSKRHISYKDGITQQISHDVDAPIDGAVIDGSVYRHMVDNVIDLGTNEADVPIRQAWQILKKWGLGVAPAVREDAKARAWRVREVPPEELTATFGDAKKASPQKAQARV